MNFLLPIILAVGAGVSANFSLWGPTVYFALACAVWTVRDAVEALSSITIDGTLVQKDALTDRAVFHHPV